MNPVGPNNSILCLNQFSIHKSQCKRETVHGPPLSHIKPSTKIFFILLGFRLQKLPSMENSALLYSKSPIIAGSSDPSRILSRRWRAFPTLRGVGVTRRQICLASAIKGGRNDGAPQKISDNGILVLGLCLSLCNIGISLFS